MSKASDFLSSLTVSGYQRPSNPPKSASDKEIGELKDREDDEEKIKQSSQVYNIKTFLNSKNQGDN